MAAKAKMDSVVWDEKRKEFVDLSRGQDVRPLWQRDEEVAACPVCLSEFSLFKRRHHCRHCGKIFCATCSDYAILLPAAFSYNGPQRTCLQCYEQLKNDRLATGANQSDRSAFNEDILTAQNYIRDSAVYRFKCPLTDIGHRISTEKVFAELTGVEGGHHTAHLISVIDFTAAPSLVSTKFFRFMMGKIQHPLLCMPEVDTLAEPRNKAITIRPFFAKGSLRDIIHKATPSHAFVRKYGRKSKSLSVEAISRFGRQILDGLLFLQQVPLAFPHLHCGNILVNHDLKSIKLSEVENTLLGLEPYYFLERGHAIAPEVECFGHVLYEMIHGEPKPTLRETDPGQPVPLLPPCEGVVYQILESIFEPELDSEPVTLESLIQLPLFANVSNYQSPSPPEISLTSKVTAVLKQVNEHTHQLLAGRLEEKQEANKQYLMDMADNLNMSVSQRNQRLLYSRASTMTSLNTASSTTPTKTVVKRSKSHKDVKARMNKPSSGRTDPPPKSNNHTEQTSVPSIPAPSTATTQNVPVAPLAPAPPSLPPATKAALPPPSAGRNALLDSIRQNNKAKLKKVETIEKSGSPTEDADTGGGGGNDLMAALAAKVKSRR